MWLPLKDGGATRDGRTDERHFVDAIATLLATTDGDEDEDMWQFANNGPLYWTKRDCSPLVPQSPRFFFPSFFRLPRQIFLAFPSLACIVPFLSVSPEGIVLASIPASSFPLRGQRTPFHANYMLSGGLLSRQPEHTGTRLIKLGNIPPHSLMFIPHSWA